MYAVAGGLPTRDEGWVYEPKWDGVRALVTVQDGALTVRSRNDLDTTRSWPELRAVAAQVPDDTVLDGEIVALNARGVPDFNHLQQRMHVQRPTSELQRSVPVSLMVFDVLRLGGRDVVRLPWSQRRELLETLDLTPPAQVTPAFDGPGQAVVDAMTGQGLEGVMAKRRSSAYAPGRRTHDWVKIKPTRRQEFVIGGWEPGKNGREGRLGAVLLGVYSDGDLVFVGEAGSGFTERSLALVQGRLDVLARDDPPFVGVPAAVARTAHWVEPRLVCEVEFLMWTNDDKLRAPVFKGLRNDKDPRDVVREEV